MSFKVQKQIKDNATSVSDFFTDLYKWSDEKEFEEKRRLKVMAKEAGKPIPVDDAPRPDPAAAKEEKQEPIRRDKTNMPKYYDKWESFDAEGEAEKLDSEEAEQQRREREARKIEKHRILDEMALNGEGDRARTSKAKPKVKISVKVSGRRASPVDLATPKKAEANQYFKDGRNREAIVLYTVALSYLEKYEPKEEAEEDHENQRPDEDRENQQPGDCRGEDGDANSEALLLKTTLFANRAAAFMKLEEWRDVVEDCCEALRFDDNHHKALLRRGFALSRMKRWRLALPDLQHVVAADASDRKAATELSMVRRMLVQGANDARKHARAQMTDPTRENKMPTRRLAVSCQRPGREVDPAWLDRDATAPKPVSKDDLASRGKSALKEIFEDDAAAAPAMAAEPAPRKPYVPKSVRIRGRQAAPGQIVSPAPRGPAASSSSAEPSRAALTFYQFEAQWLRQRAAPQERLNLLKRVGASQLPTLFRESLDAELVASIADTLLSLLQQDDSVAKFALSVMTALPEAPRFDLCASTLAPGERRRCGELLDALQERGVATPDALIPLREAFGRGASSQGLDSLDDDSDENCQGVPTEAVAAGLDSLDDDSDENCEGVPTEAARSLDAHVADSAPRADSATRELCADASDEPPAELTQEGPSSSAAAVSSFLDGCD